eukprot:m.173393 g.173393  ORF g.173393 m.173393 type:complete len:87 (+) comp18299_c2_seq6:2175-2435(+)
MSALVIYVRGVHVLPHTLYWTGNAYKSSEDGFGTVVSTICVCFIRGWVWDARFLGPTRSHCVHGALQTTGSLYSALQPPFVRTDDF